MNQQVDIEKCLEGFRSEITRQKATIKDLTDNVARLNRRVEAQNVEIKSLKSENKDLRDRLTKYEDPQPPKNPGNSSVPESEAKTKRRLSKSGRSGRLHGYTLGRRHRKEKRLFPLGYRFSAGLNDQPNQHARTIAE